MFASRDLDVGDIAINYNEIRESGGGYYTAPSGVVGHYWPQNIDGGALIVKQGESFLQQVYAWGNSGPVMSKSLLDVTKQIETIEESADEDMNGDGFIGTPETEGTDIEVASVIYDNPDADFDRSIYKMTDGSVRLAEQGLLVGDFPYDAYDQLKTKDGLPIETAGIVGALWLNNGFGVIYNNNDVIKQQSFNWGNRGLVPGKQRDVSKQIHKIEERANIDFNGDGSIGEQEVEVVVSSVVFDNPDSNFDRSIYKLTDGSVRLAEQGLTEGDMPFEGYDELKDKNGSPIETDGLVGALWLDNGFGIVYKKDAIVELQSYKWGGRGLKIKGKLRDITKQVNKLEEREGFDINGDGIVFGQIDDEAEVQTVIFQASRNDGFDRSLYNLTNGSVILGEPGLEPGDLPLDNDPLLNADGSSYVADGAVGLMGMRNGLAVLLQRGEEYVMQRFSYKGNLKAKGKERSITKRIHDFEDREGRDFTGDGIIGEPYSGQDPEVSRVIFQGNDQFDAGLYQMNNGDLVFAESDLDLGDTPFDDEIINNKKGQPYSGANVVGLYPIKKGFALVEYVDGVYLQQGFRETSGSPKPYGKARKVKNIDKIERRTGFDINGDDLIAQNDFDEFFDAMTSDSLV